MTMRAKGKGLTLSEAEKEEPYKKLREEELRCQLMQQKLRGQRRMLDQMQAAHDAPEGAVPRRHARPQVIAVKEDPEQSESEDQEEGEYHHRRQYQDTRAAITTAQSLRCQKS
jgi:hypothetical protein